jgi:hypothetical protein
MNGENVSRQSKNTTIKKKISGKECSGGEGRNEIIKK